MNKSFKYIMSGLLLMLIACSPDDTELLDTKVSADQIRIIELRADHSSIIPNDKSVMEFKVIAYGINKIKHLVYVRKEKIYKDTIKLDTFVIPNDQLPLDLIKVYDQDNKPLVNNKMIIKSYNDKSLKFIAKAGALLSNEINIKVRDVKDNKYEEIVFPVIFHLLLPPVSSGPSYAVPIEKLQRKIDELNIVFNQLSTSNPNGGNARIVFKLAEYDKSGRPLKVKGTNVVKLSEKLSQSQYYDYINDNLVWDSKKYLNVWLAKYSTRWSDSGGDSYQAEVPTVILSSAQAIKGLEAKQVDAFDNGDIKNFTDVGILLNYREFINKFQGYSNIFEFSTIMGTYLGLLPMKYSKKYVWSLGKYVENLVDGDTDFCADTYVYDYTYSIFKKGYVKKDWFTSFNIMADYSRKNSISYDQASRIRSVVQSCPSRWSYKSDWAFTGK